MLTVGQLRSHVKLAVGGDPSTMPGMTVADRIAEIINHAGQTLYAHEWRFRERTASPLSVVGGQGWVALPDDADELVSVESTGALAFSVRLVTPRQFHDASAAAAFPGIGYIACLTQGTGAGQPARRLDIHPVPASSAANDLTVRYRASWPEITAATPDATEIAVPAYAYPVMVELVRSFAEGGEAGDMQQRIAQIAGGPSMILAARKDGGLQPDYGVVSERPIEGGGPPMMGWAAMKSDQRLVPIDFLAGDWTGGTLLIAAAAHGRGGVPLMVQVFATDGALVDVDVAIDGSGNITITHPTGGFAGDVRIFG